MLNHQDFDNLVKNLKSNVTSPVVQIELSDDPSLEYGWEPDGSGMKWKNSGEDSQKVGIESYDFHFPIFKTFTDEDLEDVFEVSRIPPFQRIERKTKHIEEHLSSLKEDISTTRKLLMVVVVIVGIVGFEFIL